MTEQKDRTWLIRYPNFSFSRPLSEADLKQKFASGEMLPKEEICAGDGYWFSLQDVKEMRKHFGDDMPLDGLFKKAAEEVTQERYAVTASIKVPVRPVSTLVHPPVTPVPVSFEEVETPKMPAWKRAFLIIFALLLGILIYVWFD